MAELTVLRESWRIRGTFTISRGSRTEAEVVVAELREETEDGFFTGRGECVPYPRYGETVDGVCAAIEGLAEPLLDGLGRDELQGLLDAGGARNALDCALWDLEAKITGRRVWQIAGLPAPKPLTTAFTISLGEPEAMAEAARKAAAYPLLKLKLGGQGDVERVRAVREVVPDAGLIVDANEAWTEQQVVEFPPALAALGVTLIEQPLPAGADAMLEACEHPVPLCADESCHDVAGLAAAARRYEVVNIKLDKSGGLTEALETARAAKEMGLGIMVGCMVGTSLAMAPATLLGCFADIVDLDGPLLLERDRAPGLAVDGAVIAPPDPELWG